jgi:wyosine [tRNA(Phe)-imidazoG37] synthetase (radical SAM superfamily)
MTAERRYFYPPAGLAVEAGKKLASLAASGVRPDYLTFVPDGEPTLDMNLGMELELLKKHGIKLAVISNSSLIHLPEVRRELALADWVSLKVDSVDEKAWRAVDRPHGALKLADILAGVEAFAREYKGRFVTETMLVKGLNDDPAGLERTAAFLARVRPAAAYILTPTRPPAESGVERASEETLAAAWNIFTAAGLKAEIVAGYEGNAFPGAGKPVEELLETCSVHPMREDAATEFLRRAGEATGTLAGLVEKGLLARTSFGGSFFYIRRLGR